jgi:NADPH-dependent 7-cyano-7-deazaguanine reductase QueF
VCNIVAVDRTSRSCDTPARSVAQILRQLCNPDAIPARADYQRLRGVAVNERVSVLAETEDFLSLSHGDTVGRVVDVA